MNFKIIVSKERNFKLIIVKILGAILKNLVAPATWLPGFVEPCGAISQKTNTLYDFGLHMFVHQTSPICAPEFTIYLVVLIFDVVV
jgi:hypothetical protein